MRDKPEYINKKDYNKCKNGIKSEIRKQFSRSEYYKKFLDDRKVIWTQKCISENFSVSRRRRVSWKCEKCLELYSRKDINVDHIKPIGRGVATEIESIPDFFQLVYCSYDNLQILCKECHKKKTKREQKEAPSFDNASF
jgi:5-methylcytosine-specific restriction endonuclease McrA